MASHDVLVAGFQPHEDVVPQGVAEEARHLGGVGAAGRDEEGGRVGDGSAVPADFPDLGQQAEQDAQQGGLAGADAAGDDGEGAALQDAGRSPAMPLVGIGEG